MQRGAAAGRGSGRLQLAAAALDAVTLLSRAVTASRRVPFEGRSLTRSQTEALYLLARARRPMTPGRLASELGVTPGAVTQLVDALRSEGLVETVANAEDARSRVVVLTARAADEVHRFEAEIVERLLPRFADLDDDELARLADLLVRVTTDP